MLLLILSAEAGAQQPPYDVFPPADPPYYRVRYEAGGQPGELIFPVNYTIWIPPGVKQLRGLVVHQHGCGEGSGKSGHPELAKVPWVLWGHSGGGHWAGGMVLLHPERVAAAWLRSGVPLLKPDPARAGIKAHTLPDPALKVPVMCNLGTKEGVTVKDD